MKKRSCPPGGLEGLCSAMKRSRSLLGPGQRASRGSPLPVALPCRPALDGPASSRGEEALDVAPLPVEGVACASPECASERAALRQRIEALRKYLWDHNIDPNIVDPTGQSRACSARNAHRGEICGEEQDRLRRLLPLLRRYRCWADGLRGWQPSVADWPPGVAPLNALEYTARGGAVKLTSSLLRKQGSARHADDHAHAVYICLKILADMRPQALVVVRTKIAEARALCEGTMRARIDSTPLAKVLIQEVRGASADIVKLISRCMAATDIYARNVEEGSLLAMQLWSTEKESKSLRICDPSRGRLALPRLAMKFFQQRGGPLNLTAKDAPTHLSLWWQGVLASITFGDEGELPFSVQSVPPVYALHLRFRDREPCVVMRARVENNATVESYTLCARLGNHTCPAVAAETERHSVAARRDWLVGVGPLTLSWTRCE